MKKYISYILWFWIGLAGPSVTFRLYYSSNEPKEDLREYIPLLLMIGLAAFLTFIVSLICQLVIKRLFRTLAAAVIISEAVYVFMITICMARLGAEGEMWLPVAILIMIPYSFPMAVSVSFATVAILRKWNIFELSVTVKGASDQSRQ